MSRPTLALLAWSTLATYAVLCAVKVLLVSRTPEALLVDDSVTLSVLWAVVLLPYAVVGALVAALRPRNPIGWLFAAVALISALWNFATTYANYALRADPGSLPGGEVMAGLSATLAIEFYPLLPFVFLLFPNGHLPSSRWRPVAWGAAVLAVVTVLDTALRPGSLTDYEGIDNPLGVEGSGQLRDIGPPLVELIGLLCLFALGLRLHRSRGAERQQLKWFVFAAAVAAFFLAGFSLAEGFFDNLREGYSVYLVQSAFFLAFAGIPASAAIAILRYRLWDIDVVINRTLVYGALTTTLAGTYLAGVLLLQLALSPLTESNSLAIAVSTLAVAALFQPARHRIQAIVDRRFYRQKYDAARTLERFGSQLRDEVDLDALGDDLRHVVADAMQPAHVTLWLRKPSGAGARNDLRTPTA